MKCSTCIFKILFLANLTGLLYSCSESHFKEDKIFAGGVLATAKSLNDGESTYSEYCMPCHGVDGDGKGASAKGLQVPPRNFKMGQYKFGRVVSGQLPRDEDFFKIIKEGLHGTAMLPWKELSSIQLFNLVQYIKSFSPEKWVGPDKKLGTAIVATKDPYGELHRESAIQRGKEVFHVVGQCWTCHRAYVSKQDLIEMNQKSNKKPITDFDSNMYYVKLQPNDYGYLSTPLEFTSGLVRSATTVEDLYIRLNAGVGGTAMPSWKGVLSDDDIWAVAHYVRSLMDLKDTPERDKLLKRAF